MKELSIEEKAKAYDEAYKKVAIRFGSNVADEIFLKESEDERIRKEMIEILKKEAHDFPSSVIAEKSNSWLSWLEKQGKQKQELLTKEKALENSPFVEQKPADMVEPKFHEGEWIIHQGTENIYKVVARIDNQYQLKYGNNYTIQKCADVDRCARLWDVTKDAKVGDILVDGNLPFIFKKIDANKYIYAYCGISVDDGFKIESEGESGEWTWMQDIKPATKEQRDKLEKAMADAGYSFDFDKKELKKIGQKPAWSEEDEEILDGIIVDIEVLKEQDRTKNGKEAYQKEIDWLESLKNRVAPQSQWKPSEEMLEALYRAIPENVMAISEDEMLLDKLYQGLKYGRVLSKN